jgi:hypothetical protein
VGVVYLAVVLGGARGGFLWGGGGAEGGGGGQAGVVALVSEGGRGGEFSEGRGAGVVEVGEGGFNVVVELVEEVNALEKAPLFIGGVVFCPELFG